MVELGTAQMKIWRIRIASWILKATDAHSEYVILLAVPLHQWLHERPSMLRYMYCTLPVLFLLQTEHLKLCGITRPWSPDNFLLDQFRSITL